MGWASGGYIFDALCEELQKSFLVPATRKKVLVRLIKALQQNDWDTEGESLDQFKGDKVVVDAFRECGVYLWGTPEWDQAYGENSFAEKINLDTAGTREVIPEYEEDDDYREFRGRW
jgi:hypothetical protein